MKIDKNQYAPFYETYISKSLKKGDDIIKNMQSSLEDFFLILSDIPVEKQLFAYEKDKWTIKELIVHLIDTERIMAYRALRISRNDKVDLLSFDENYFIANSIANTIPFTELLKEFSLVRKSNIAMFKGFDEEILQRRGRASGSEITVSALGFILSGHVFHHLDVIKERYL